MLEVIIGPHIGVPLLNQPLSTLPWSLNASLKYFMPHLHEEELKRVANSSYCH